MLWKIGWIAVSWMICWGMSLHGADPVRIRIASYNVESLYDTLPDPHTDDREFTPQGARRWNSGRYDHKIRNLARVIDDLQADLLALQEVENEAVVRDLLMVMESGYNYIHRESRDKRGIDVALLYRGTRFTPRRIGQISGRGLSRRVLVVEGELCGEPFIVMVCHLPSQLNPTRYRNEALASVHRAADSLCAVHPGQKILLMGDFNRTPTDRTMRRTFHLQSLPSDPDKPIAGNQWYTPFLEMARQGYGSLVYRDRRQLFDFIVLNGTCATTGRFRYQNRQGIFVRDYMIHTSGLLKGYPLRSFHAGRYTGGYSDHLPVFLDLERSDPSNALHQ